MSQYQSPIQTDLQWQRAMYDLAREQTAMLRSIRNLNTVLTITIVLLVVFSFFLAAR